MKAILMFCLIGISAWPLHKAPINAEDNLVRKNNPIIGEWSEKKSGIDSTEGFKVVFFPGGKVNVVRKLQNYIGYYKIHNDNINQIDGAITIADKYPFNATFVNPNEIKLTIINENKSETRYLIKTKEIKSGFQFIDKNL
jgi:hypothetical protein